MTKLDADTATDLQHLALSGFAGEPEYQPLDADAYVQLERPPAPAVSMRCPEVPADVEESD